VLPLNTYLVSPDLDGLIAVLDAVPHTTKSLLTLSRGDDTDTTSLYLELKVTWRRQSPSQTYEWNTILIEIPDLTFFPFAPRILAGHPLLPVELVLTIDVTPHMSHPDHTQYLVTYTFENPTSILLHVDIQLESSNECGFAGPKSFGLNLFAFTTYELKMVIIPIVAEWARLPRLVVVDEERKTTLEILRMSDDLKIEGQDLFIRVLAK
jgi:hypothetical protein